MADNSSTQSTIDPYEQLKISLNADGSLNRYPPFPDVPPAENHDSDANQPVISKDIPLNPTTKTWLRIFSPPQKYLNSKLPLIIYFHGGGFILFSAASLPFHKLCSGMAIEIPAVIVSVDYRLGPENRLPAAYDDAIDAILWVKKQATDADGERWLKDSVDFSRCFLMGSSAGGNIVYYAGLRALDLDLGPLKISGLIHHQPFFGGVERTKSELASVNDPFISLQAYDLLWELSLPAGADRNHEFCDFEKVKNEKIGLLPKCLVRSFCGDLLIDRQREFAKMLARNEVDVVTDFEEEGSHGAELFDPKKAQAMFMAFKDFILSFRNVDNDVASVMSLNP